MKYITHSEIRDPYPLDSNPIDGINQNYIGANGKVELLGKFKGNSINWNRENVENIQVISEEHSFRFILDIDGILYSSNSFKNDLKDAIEKRNPYFNLETVTVIPLSLQELKTPNQVYEFGEKYAEVTINTNINSGEDSEVILKTLDHINWLSDENNKELREVTEMGSWTLNTTDFNPNTDTGMGVEFSEDMEREKKSPPQSTVPNEEVETSVTTTQSTTTKIPNTNPKPRTEPTPLNNELNNNIGFAERGGDGLIPSILIRRRND